jgi:hypothetical protein
VRVAKAGHCVKPAPADDSNFRLLQTGSERWGELRFFVSIPAPQEEGDPERETADLSTTLRSGRDDKFVWEC